MSSDNIFMTGSKDNNNYAFTGTHTNYIHQNKTPDGLCANLQGQSRGNRTHITDLQSKYTEELLQRLKRIEDMLFRDNSSGGRVFPAQNRPAGFLPRPGIRNTPNYQTETGNCFYHERFGAAARNCKQPCNFSRKPNQSNFNINKNFKNDMTTQNTKN